MMRVPSRTRGALRLGAMLLVASLAGTAAHAVDATGASSSPKVDSADGQTLRWHVAVVPAQAKPGDEVEVVFTADIGSGWILYSSDFEVEIGPRPAKFTFDASPALSLVGPVTAIGSKWKKDASLGTEYSYFATRAEFRQKAKVLAPVQSVSGRIDAQTCFEASGVCELFREKFSAAL
jgi:hypothetical protein